MLAIRGIGKTISNYMVFDPAVGPWRTVSLAAFRDHPEIFSPIYDFTIAPGTEANGWNEVVTARFPTGVPIKLRLLKPEYFSVNQWGDLQYEFPTFSADGLYGLGAGPSLNEPWRLIELNLSNVPFTEIRVANNGLQLLNVSGNNRLNYLDCSLNNLTDATFDMEESGWLVERDGEWQREMAVLNARSNSLSTAPFISTGEVYKYDVANNQISTINVAKRAPYLLDASNQFPNNAAQGLTALTFSDGVNRPAYWYVENNRLTSLAMGTTVGELSYLGWSAVRELKCSNNLITELLFPDGPLPANNWSQGTTPGGYRLYKLDVSGNPLSVLNLQHIDTLLELDISDTAITSLALPPNIVTTYPDPPNDSGLDGDLEEFYDPSAPDVITGGWRIYDRFRSLPTSPNIRDSYFYRHTRGIRKLTARNCQLATWPENTKSLREIYISNAPLTRIGNPESHTLSSTTGDELPIQPVVGTTSNPWVPISFSGFNSWGGVQGVTAGGTSFDRMQIVAQANSPERAVLVFRNLTFNPSAVIPAGLRQIANNVVYMVHRVMAFTTTAATLDLFLTDQIDLEAVEWDGNPGNYPPTKGSTITTQGVTGGQVAVYRPTLFPFLETLEVEDCLSLTRIHIASAGFLKKLVVRNCPNVVGSLVNNDDASISSEFRWLGGSGHLTHVEVVNTRAARVISNRNPFYRQSYDQIRIQNTNGVVTSVRIGGGNGGGFRYVCRNGVWITNIGSSAAAGAFENYWSIEYALVSCGTWSFSPTLPTDSNVISFAGSFYPLSRKAANYDVRKAGAISRGWQVIDPTFV